jgi:leucyl aminopeptidase
MDAAALSTPASRVEADVLGLALAEPPTLSAAARELDEALGGRLARLVEDGDATGKRGTVAVLHTDGDVPARRVALAGLGPEGESDADAVRTAAAHAAAVTGESAGRRVAWLLDGETSGLRPAEEARAVVDGVALGRYDAGRWKTGREEGERVARVVLVGAGAAEAEDAAARAALVARWANRARDLVNAPANELTPAALAEAATEVAGGFATLSAEVLGREEIEAAGLGALAAVGQGSHNGPRLVTLRYEPPGAPDGLVLGLVGKSITFDTGGISLKPLEGLEEMKSDMAGGAAALAGLGAIAELGLPLRVVAVLTAAENMPAGHAYRPGDIVRAGDGTTIEVTNTDAEGRLVLADALLHARKAGATHLLDVATLTGTIQVALGDLYAGLFGNDEVWLAEVGGAAERSGDHAWPMPLHRSYGRFLESQFADVKNTPERKRGSSSIGAVFLQRFAGEGPWAHLDIAGTAYIDRGRDYYARPGATGFGVRLIAELATALTSDR